VAVNSATSALHIACLALGLKAGDVLWTSPVTFVASANCALYCGARVDFVDIDPLTFNLSFEALKLKLERAKARGALPKVLVCVHLCGQSCDMRAIHQLSLIYGFKIIEDASHAIGAEYQDSSAPNTHPLGDACVGGGFRPVGDCRHSDICVFSFHPVKIITTGEGGMATTKCPELAERMREFRSHGVTRKTERMTSPTHGPWYYQMKALGLNYRMTDISAALGLSQLGRLDKFIQERRSISQHYDEHFNHNDKIGLQEVPAYTRSARHLYVVRVPEASHLETFEALRAKGIGVNLHYIPIHLQPFYQTKGFKAGDFLEAERYYREAISLPIYPGLSTDDQRLVIDTLLDAVA
jgi:UDP-4-amino-4,6-dideoxy-N-acetyl-beta-L-altrosamine transaminase